MVLLLCAGCPREPAPPLEAPPPAAPIAAPAPALPPVTPEPAITPVVAPVAEPLPARREVPKVPDSPLLLDRVAGYAIVQLPVEGFDRLTPNQRITAYHLARASVAGRDIAWDQGHRLALGLRAEVARVLKHEASLPRDLVVRIRRWARLLWICNGPYHPRTGKKLVPPFTREEWSAAAARSGTAVSSAETLERWSFMFDPTIQPLQTVRNAPDALTASANNLYDGVSTADLSGFEEQYPLNSRLKKQGEQLVEQVYRVGRVAAHDERPAPAGHYAAELARVVEHLNNALPHMSDAQRRTARHLADYLETGSIASFEQSNLAWLSDDPVVELVMGFIETDLDPRGIKGEWEGLVGIVDEQTTALMRGLADHIQHFEDASPWPDEFRKTHGRVFLKKAIQVVAAHGGAGPDVPMTMNLPNQDTIREQKGARFLLMTNALRAADAAAQNPMVTEFALPVEREAALRWAPRLVDIMMVLHEVIGHRTGKVGDELEDQELQLTLREYGFALEEARAELVALHHIWDPIVARVAVCPAECADAAYRAYARRAHVQLHRVRGARIEDEHMRGTQLIVQYARSRGAIATEEHGGKRYVIVKDVPLMRAAVSELLGKLMRIKATGDHAEAKRLFDTFGVTFDVSLRDDAVRRATKARIPDHYIFVMPELEPVLGPDKRIIDVKLRVERDFDAQMRRWDQPS